MFSLKQCFSKDVCDLLEEGVVRVDGRRRIILANRFACKLLETPRRLLQKKRAAEVNHPLLERGCLLLQEAREQKQAVSDSFNVEGKGYFELIAYAPSRNRGVIILRDRSNQKQVIEMGKAFVANASHELRTPITIIKGFAETLQDLPELSLEMLGEITEKIVRNCQRMENLVKSLLTLSDLETLPYSRFQECDLCQVIESCRHLLAPCHPQAQVELIAPASEVFLFADPHVLELAIFNLFENAAKYSSSAPHIVVTIKVEEEGVQLVIRDNGIGMAPHDLEHIFERFYTANKARSRKLGGAGIGLSIVKTIVQKLDGTISVESELGKGTAFTLCFSTRGEVG